MANLNPSFPSPRWGEGVRGPSVDESGPSPSPCFAVGPFLSPSGRGISSRNCKRLSEARLHAVSSRNMYSEHGLEARISPEAGQVCQSLMVVWNWMPGSADAQAAWPILSPSARALSVLVTLPVSLAVRLQS